MARTPEEIALAILAKKDTYPELAIFNSSSATSIVKLWADVMGGEISMFEELFEQYKAELQEKVDLNIYGTPSWYVTILKAFQEGFNLEVLPNGTLGYSTIDVESNIIKHASFLEQAGGFILLKVATETDGELAPLSAAQLTQVTTYINKRRPAGTKPTIISEAADKLRMSADIYYNPLINFESLKLAVKEAITNHVKNLDFDGIVYTSRLQDAVQVVEGVEDIFITELTGISSLETTVFERNYRSRAGYLIPDATVGFTLDDTLTFIPNS